MIWFHVYAFLPFTQVPLGAQIAIANKSFRVSGCFAKVTRVCALHAGTVCQRTNAVR